MWKATSIFKILKQKGPLEKKVMFLGDMNIYCSITSCSDFYHLIIKRVDFSAFNSFWDWNQIHGTTNTKACSSIAFAFCTSTLCSLWPYRVQFQFQERKSEVYARFSQFQYVALSNLSCFIIFIWKGTLNLLCQCESLSHYHLMTSLTKIILYEKAHWIWRHKNLWVTSRCGV